MPDSSDRLYVGLISGTSVDGIDAVVAQFGDRSIELSAHHSHPYPPALRDRLLSAIREPSQCHIDEVGSLDVSIGAEFASAVTGLLDMAGLDAADIEAIGSHGQTLRHRPDDDPPFTIQAGDPSVIATRTGIRTVADFRRQDLALGGQGAPLVPPFHEWLFARPGECIVVANIGGIGNLTLLPGDGRTTTGFDTGPGNTLMDAWIRQHLDLDYDANGDWAASGAVDEGLLRSLLADEYIRRAPPKSTGFERFNLGWLEGFGVARQEPEDVQATLLEFTARSLAAAVAAEHPGALYLCGGGAANRRLVERIDALLPDVRVDSTEALGLPPDWVEAAAFAWLARERLAGRPGNLPAVTGASRPSLLGGVYSP